MKMTTREIETKKPEEFYPLGNGWYHKIFEEDGIYYKVHYQKEGEYICIPQKRIQILSWRFEDTV